jgi:hypothetical protein
MQNDEPVKQASVNQQVGTIFGNTQRTQVAKIVSGSQDTRGDIPDDGADYVISTMNKFGIGEDNKVFGFGKEVESE